LDIFIKKRYASIKIDAIPYKIVLPYVLMVSGKAIRGLLCLKKTFE